MHLHRHGHGNSNKAQSNTLKVYLRQDIIDHSFDQGASLNLNEIKDFKYEELKTSCSHSHGNGGLDLDKDDEECNHDDSEKISIHDIFLLNHKGKYIRFWNMLDTICCLYSGYLWAWVACFGIGKNSN